MTHEQLHKALMHAQDMLERSSIPFILLDDAAAQIRTELPTLSMKRITIGVLEKHLTAGCLSTLKSLVKVLEEKGVNYYYEYEGVPILLRVIHRHYDVFERPDVRFYYTGEFRIPNPFEKYWRMRQFIT